MHAAKKFCQSFSVYKRHFHSRRHLRISPEVGEALKNQQPVVALESTIITHGMPYPQNINTALEVEGIVREQGAIPATVAVLNHKLHVGLEREELETLARGDKNVLKVSRRDLGVALAKGYQGGTTVSGTMVAAHQAGIHVFVTGGIGGVHRGAATSFDVSADLTELGRTPLAVVSAGVKSILDIPATLEYLETQGVTVMTYGDKDADFPAFFTRNSGMKAPYNVQSPQEAAAVIGCSLDLQLGSGLVVGVPVPEEQAADAQMIEDAIQRALIEAKQQGIEGKLVTPFILARVNELTVGKSLTANIALVRNNALIGSQIACSLAEYRTKPAPPGQSSYALKKSADVPKISTHAPNINSKGHSPNSESVEDSEHMDQKVVVIGGTNIDFTCTFREENVKDNGGTYGGSVRQSMGGVGRNMAEGLTRLGCRPLFISAVGEDLHAQTFLHQAAQCNMDVSGVHQSGNSATYCAVMRPCGNLIYGIGDFDAHKLITPEHVSQFEPHLSEAAIIVMDGNIPQQTMAYICDVAENSKVPEHTELLAANYNVHA